MKNSIKRIFLMLLVVSPLVFAAGPKTFNWVNPITRMDGSPFDPASEQKQTNIKCGASAGGPYTDIYIVAGATISAQINNVVADGTWYCVVSAVDMQGREGGPSNEVNFTISPDPVAPPAAPVLSVN